MHRTKKSVVTLFAFIALASFASVQVHGHGQGGEEHHSSLEMEKTAGPNGGRIVNSEGMTFEIFVADSGNVQVTFLGDDGAPIAPDGQEVTLIGGSRMNPLTSTFTRQDDVLVSDTKIPTDKVIPIVIQVKGSADSKVVREKFNLNMGKCPTCEYSEYACVCHEDEDEEPVEEEHSHGGSSHSH